MWEARSGTDEHFMRQALMLAEQAFEEGEVPIGAIVVCENRIIGKGYNQTERLQDPTAHAEMIAITAACDYLGHKFLEDCILYVTIEPCAMCAGALSWSRVGKVVFGASEPKTGFMRFQPDVLHPKTEISYGVMATECAVLMKEFFQSKRQS